MCLMCQKPRGKFWGQKKDGGTMSLDSLPCPISWEKSPSTKNNSHRGEAVLQEVVSFPQDEWDHREDPSPLYRTLSSLELSQWQMVLLQKHGLRAGE